MVELGLVPAATQLQKDGKDALLQAGCQTEFPAPASTSIPGAYFNEQGRKTSKIF